MLRRVLIAAVGVAFALGVGRGLGAEDAGADLEGATKAARAPEGPVEGWCGGRGDGGVDAGGEGRASGAGVVVHDFDFNGEPVGDGQGASAAGRAGGGGDYQRGVGGGRTGASRCGTRRATYGLGERFDPLDTRIRW